MKKLLYTVSIILFLCTGSLNGCIESEKNNIVQPEDTDRDGLSDEQERLAGTNVTNSDSDADGIDDFFETDNGTFLDTDDDSVLNALDSDDDGDGIPTINETPDENGDGDPSDAFDADNDGIPDYLDVDIDDNSAIQLTSFIGAWQYMDNEDEHWIFYVNSSLKKTSVEIDEITQEPYLLTIWSRYYIKDNVICFKDQDAPEEELGMCFKYVFSENNTICNVFSNSEILFSLYKE